MSDDEFDYSDGERRTKGQEAVNMLKKRQERNITELDDTLSDFIEEWRVMRKKEDEDLARLKARQAKRKVKRADEEKKMKIQKKEEEERKAKEEAELKKKEEEERLRRLEEMEKKRHESTKKAGEEKQKREGGDKLSSLQAARGEKGKTREQLVEEKKIALMIRVAPLTGLDDMNLSGLCAKAEELWKKVIRLETEKYDMEQKRARQDYDLRELETRQKVKLRHLALKKGLDSEALTGKHPPKIQVASKFERRADSRSYDDKKNLFEGGYEIELKNHVEQVWKEKYDEFVERNKSKLPKWFGERPGKGGQYDYDSDEDENEDEDDDDYSPAAADDDDDDEEEESSEEEEDDEESEEEETEDEDSESEEE